MATAIPQQHLPSRHLVDIVTKIIVRTKNQFGILRQLVHYFLSIAARHHHIRQCLYGCRRVHIRHYLITRMLILVFLQVLCPTRVGQRTAGIQVRTQYRLLRRQQFAGLSHEVHAAHHHHLCICLRCLAGQSQRVAHKVGHLLYVSHRIVMGQNNCIFLLTESTNLLFQVSPFFCRLIYVSLLLPFVFQHHIIYFIFSFFLKK